MPPKQSRCLLARAYGRQSCEIALSLMSGAETRSDEIRRAAAWCSTKDEHKRFPYGH